MSNVRKHRPYSVVPSQYRGSFEIVGCDGHRFGAHWSSVEIAQEYADALNGFGPGPDEPLKPDQARAFLNALWPEGDTSYLSNHARTYFEALIGDVPRGSALLSYVSPPDIRPMTSTLRRIADALEEIANDGAAKKRRDDMPF